MCYTILSFERDLPKLSVCRSMLSFFFFNDTATTEIYTLSLHDALPISVPTTRICSPSTVPGPAAGWDHSMPRSEEHTSELQSRLHLVCRLLLEKKKTKLVAAQLHKIC